MKRFLLSILCCLMAVVSGYAEDKNYSYTFTSKQFSANGTKTLNNVDWTLSGDGNYWGYDGTKGHQFGSGNAPYKSLILSTDGIPGTIKKIVINTSGASSTNAKLVVTVGGHEYGSQRTLTTTATNYPFDGTATGEYFSGEIKLLYTQTISKAIYIKSITITYVSDSSEPTPPANPTIELEGDATFEEQVIANVNVESGHTAYYTLDGNTPTNESTKYTKPLTIKATATLKVVAYDKDGYKSDVVTQAFTHKSGSAGTATLVTSDADIAVGDKVVIVASGYNYALSTTQNNNNRGQVAITKNGDNVTVEEGVQILTLEEGTKSGSFAFNTGSGYLYAASSNSNHLKTQTTNNDNGSWKIEIAENGVATIKAQGKNSRNWLRYNQASSLFSCYSSGQEDVSLYKVNLATVEPYVLNVSAAGWATLYLGYDVTIPKGVTCYVISAVTAESATLTEVTDVLPANTGVIVEATEGEYTFEVAETADDVESILTGTTKNEYVKAAGYVLGVVDGNVGLYMAEMNGGVFLNNANKAYLPASVVSTTQGTKALKFRFDDQTTGINGVATGKKPEVIFDLYGRKVNNATAPGLYIINGKKVMVK